MGLFMGYICDRCGKKEAIINYHTRSDISAWCRSQGCMVTGYVEGSPKKGRLPKYEKVYCEKCAKIIRSEKGEENYKKRGGGQCDSNLSTT